MANMDSNNAESDEPDSRRVTEPKPRSISEIEAISTTPAHQSNPTENNLKVVVPNPCSFPWEEMIGDERTRVCGGCNKHVYNIVGMSEEEIGQLLRTGRVCAAFQRAYECI